MVATFILREPIEWKDSLVIVAFPTEGNAGNIAGHYIRKTLNLPLLGSIHLDGQEGVVAVENGIGVAPLRIYGGQVQCNLGDERCPTVHIILSDLPLSSAAADVVAEALLSESAGCRMVLAFDSMERDLDDHIPDVFATALDEATLAILQGPKVKPLPDGILVGMTGNLMLEAARQGVPAGALVVEALKHMPDGRAAAALVAVIDRLLPQVKVDNTSLQAEAEFLEKQVQKTQEELAHHHRVPHADSFI